jgi:hypothetical protein
MTGRENTIFAVMLLALSVLIGVFVYNYMDEIEQRQTALEETRG